MREKHSRVNFKKLVTDLADMYHDETFDVVVAELTANALDAGARSIAVDWDGLRHILVMTDDGRGMNADEFEQYHDLAAELKTRGDGIGFAGVGAKISFNIAARVLTETRHQGKARASDWYWGPGDTLRWKPLAPGQLRADGTRVEIHFDAKQTPPITAARLEQTLRRHYRPLFITDFARAYQASGRHAATPRFQVNGRLISQTDLSTDAALVARKDVEIKVGRAPAGWGAVGVSARDYPVDGGRYGVLLCTHAKVIKAETFGLPTGMLGAKLYGIFEIPALIEYLTANKTDVKSRGRAPRRLDRILGAVREAVQEFLQEQGVQMARPQHNPLSGKLERELQKIVQKLPELRDFDGLTPKGRKLQRSDDGNIAASEIPPAVGDKNHAAQYNANDGDDKSDAGGRPRRPDAGGNTRARPRRSRKHQGPRVAFEDHPHRPETAWLNADTIVINSGHTAYRNRATNTQARLTYCMFSIGVALDKADLAQNADGGGASYVDRFVAAWGGM